MRIDVYSHGFTVSRLSVNTRIAAARLCRFLGHFELQPTDSGRYEQTLMFVYAGALLNREQFCFHNAVLDRFLAIVREVAPEVTPEIVHHDLYEPVAVEIVMRDLRPPRDNQPQAIEYALGPGRTKMICLGPGRGKTFVFNRAAQQIGQRVAMILRAQYLDKWEGDFCKAHMAEPEDIRVIRGGKELARLMHDALDGSLTERYVLISNSTYRNYLTLYETSSGSILNQGFPLRPQEFMQAMGVGLLGIDEVHQDFHFNHRAIIYNHVPKIICLSGSIDPDNTFKDSVTRLTFPVHDRFVEPPPPPYLRVKALQYKLSRPDLLKWKNRGRPEYSQTAFEKSIIQHPKALKAYIDMILDICRRSFDPVYKPGRKLLVFCGSKHLCTLVAAAFAKAYPARRVRRYIGGDPLSNLTEDGEIIVGTTKSCGTAHDVPGLAISIMTEAVNDTQANQQHIKRLRKPPEGPDYFTPEFLYLLCADIPQHMNYHRHKIDIFRSEVLSHELLMTDYVI